MQISPESLLVRLKDKILLKLNIDSAMLKNYIVTFVNNILRNSTPSKMHYSIVNMNNEFTSNKMTIKCFFKFLMVIRIKKIKFTLTVTDNYDREVTVTEEISLNINFNEVMKEEVAK